MTAAVNLLRQLRAAGVDVVKDADRLRLRSRTPLQPDLIELVRKHKPDLLAVLAGDHPPTASGLVTADPEVGTARLRARSDPAAQLMTIAACRFDVRRAGGGASHTSHRAAHGVVAAILGAGGHATGRAGAASSATSYLRPLRLISRRFGHDGAVSALAESAAPGSTPLDAIPRS
jgi:hypothetical protein